MTVIHYQDAGVTVNPNISNNLLRDLVELKKACTQTSGVEEELNKAHTVANVKKRDEGVVNGTDWTLKDASMRME